MLLQSIFSITNEGIYKVLRIFGIKFKFKNKKSILTDMNNEILNKINYHNLKQEEILFDLQNITRKLSMPDNIWQFNNTKFYVPNYPSDIIQRFIVNNNAYFEEEVLVELDSYISQNSTILDLGANIGNHTLYWLLSSPKNIRKVYSFEPVKSTFDILSKNIEINNLESRTTLYNIGLYDSNSYGIIVKYFAENIGEAKIESSESGNITLKRLDDIQFEEDSIEFIKIDVEGAEYHLLTGAENFIKHYKPTIFIESFPENYDKVHNFLTNLNYELVKEFPYDNYLYEYKNL